MAGCLGLLAQSLVEEVYVLGFVRVMPPTQRQEGDGVRGMRYKQTTVTVKDARVRHSFNPLAMINYCDVHQSV